MHREQSDRLAASIVEFCRFARSRGVAAHPGQTITALEAVKTINPTDQQSLTSVLQSALCSTGEEWDIFPELFDEFWGESRSRARSASGEHKGPSNKNRHDREAGSTVFLDQPGNESAAGNGDGKAVYGASAQ